MPPRLLLGGLEVAIKWSRRRRTIGLTVTAAGEVVILAPQGTALDLLRQALKRHRAWIEGKLAARAESWSRLRAGEVHFLGEAYRLRLEPRAAAPVALGAGEMLVKEATEAAAWPLVSAWYRRQAELRLRERVRHYAGALEVPAPRVELREWRRRWGECRPAAELRFNWRLILLPPDLLDYVVVHEIAHLKEPGHTPKFWQEVARVLPDYRLRRRWLNQYGAPFLLWRLGEKPA